MYFSNSEVSLILVALLVGAIALFVCARGILEADTGDDPTPTAEAQSCYDSLVPVFKGDKSILKIIFEPSGRVLIVREGMDQIPPRTWL